MKAKTTPRATSQTLEPAPASGASNFRSLPPAALCTPRQPSLFELAPDTDMADLICSASGLANFAPALLELIAADLDAHALAKKKQRTDHARWQTEQTATLIDVIFTGNLSETGLSAPVGALAMDNCTAATLTRVTFEGNSGASAASFSECSPFVTSCTFYGNSGYWSPLASLTCYAGAYPTLEQTIIAFGTNGAAIDCAGVETRISATTASSGSSPARSIAWAPDRVLWTWFARRATSDNASLPIEPSGPGGRPSSRAVLARSAVNSEAR